MGLRGMLTKDHLGFSMPSSGPLYPKPPYRYRGASMIVFEYVTDGPSAAGLLPAQAELTDPPVAGLVFADYPESTLGPYREVVLYLHATYQGKPIQYAAYLYVTTDVAMAAGREMGGFPKKIAAISFDDAGTIAGTLQRPEGLPLASGSLRPVGEPVQAPDSTLDYLTLRIIPSPTRDAPPSVSELLETGWSMSNTQVWQGDGSCTIEPGSENDPLHLLPVVKLLGCKLVRCDLEVSANETSRSQPL
ncbi:acetoacetate decarboxylase family protein [Isosphaeraceae bacterium EP7]